MINKPKQHVFYEYIDENLVLTGTGYLLDTMKSLGIKKLTFLKLLPHLIILIEMILKLYT
ncbi:hypothetical protein SAMN04488137_4696 [Fictibacillus solisalsi]|uniref:Uncharacterized protein n=1 Tax=Fictibacillus solisalsi TaxID=459525 RepID=A0A1H0BYK3_9BACL|nr:hypothetical protein SAMN04488137_4696 [Fictibacillus solisalsi]